MEENKKWKKAQGYGDQRDYPNHFDAMQIIHERNSPFCGGREKEKG